MTLLLDTHFVIEILERKQHGFHEPDVYESAMERDTLVVSVLSFWEAEIKARRKKLHLASPVSAWAELLDDLEVTILPIKREHVLAEIGQEPPHRDPFDRLLLSTAAAEMCQLLTRDRILQSHPLAWRPFPQ